ncbi:SDR family oxidoreductase [Frankia gtarii]|uniref:SDR family oxidoreductase n=1 Tax=Frankia gtarii TaxID=2950102 RepID=UPI0021C0B58E|nr:SDR family oxidoreductase [Frankia gtarii]
MLGRVEGKVVVVTGAGRGIGRGEALEFARHGARVVVNDYGADRDGTGRRSEVAEAVVEEIRSAGGAAVANADDISDWDGARNLIDSAISEFGRLDVLVNNAGILRDRTVANMSIEEWDDVIRVHLRGTFATLRHSAAYWKDLAKSGTAPDARVINTSSGSGLFGNPGQSNYGAAKAGIASLTIIAAQELARYGVRVNAIAPTGLTRMTEDRPVAAAAKALRDSGSKEFIPLDPDNVAPMVVWLASEAAKDVTGRVFLVSGGSVSVAEPWARGPAEDKGARWEVEELDGVIPGLLAKARDNVQLKKVG